VVIGGDLEYGMTRGHGLGKLLAELATTGQAPLDIDVYRMDRWGSAIL
jgi:glycine/D-amino acid oxidase-like deaminating enzyme